LDMQHIQGFRGLESDILSVSLFGQTSTLTSI